MRSLYRLAHVWYHDTTHEAGQAEPKFMPKRGTDADNRIFFDELVSVSASRLKATGAIRPEDRYGVIAFSDEDHVVKRQKFVGVTHTKFPNGGAWS